MHKQLITSEWGVAQRAENRGRDLSLKEFRELICPCMSHSKQRGTADEIVAGFKHCLHTWDVCMRKKDRNVRLEIARCSSTECPQHKEGSESAEIYAKASKTTSNFLSCLCGRCRPWRGSNPGQQVSYFSENLNKYASIQLKATILNSSPIDLVIGLQSIISLLRFQVNSLQSNSHGS
jgi:hypothetical protein